jgi:hypothetical protein
VPLARVDCTQPEIAKIETDSPYLKSDLGSLGSGAIEGQKPRYRGFRIGQGGHLFFGDIAAEQKLGRIADI